MEEVSFSEAMAKKYPEWVVFVTSCDEQGRGNVMPAGWAMIASENPPMFAVAINQRAYTHELIRAKKAFGVAFPVPGMEEAIRYCGSCSGREVHKFGRTTLTPVPATRIAPPLISGCVVNLECTLAEELQAGDHTLFLGRVVAAHVEEKVEGRLLNFGDGMFAVPKKA